MNTIFSNPAGFQSILNNVYVVFPSRKKACAAIEPLQKKGFLGTEILLFVSHRGSLLDYGTQGTSKAAEDAVVGLLTGAVLGCIVGAWDGFGLFAGISSNHFVLGMLGFALGAMFGAPIGAIIGFASKRFNLILYETWLREGRVLVLVEAKETSRATEARDILQNHGGHQMLLENIVKKVG